MKAIAILSIFVLCLAALWVLLVKYALPNLGKAACVLGLHKWEPRRSPAHTIINCERAGCDEFRVAFPPIPKRRAF